jgi:hypothetical protein
MISYNRFTLFLKKLLLDPLYLYSQGFSPSHSTDIKDFLKNSHGTEFGDAQSRGNDINGFVLWYHEEPLNAIDIDHFLIINYFTQHNDVSPECKEWREINFLPGSNFLYDVSFHIFANSEKSVLKNQWFKKFSSPGKYYDWYFFFHGFTALDWYRDFYLLANPYRIEPTKVFISLNHLIQKKRNYRIVLLSLLEEKKLLSHGLVSYPLISKELVKKEIFDVNSLISAQSKKHILNNLFKNLRPYKLDEIDYNLASANISREMHMAIWNIVTETVFYENKLHLTEKIFKPIAIKRPFILVGAVGNLEYLRSYGFKTFDRWIDESYDSEPDHDLRMQKIVKELERLCNLTFKQNLDILSEMQEVLEYNHNHFFTTFKEIIVEELVDNFEKCTKMYNQDLSERFRLPVEKINFQSVKQILLTS